MLFQFSIQYHNRTIIYENRPLVTNIAVSTQTNKINLAPSCDKVAVLALIVYNVFLCVSELEN